jgi:multidrug efflux system membrane fusion protein
VKTATEPHSLSFPPVRARTAPHLHVLALAALTLCLGACHKAVPAASAPRSVVSLTVQATAAAPTVRAPAQIEARYVTPMAFRVTGQVVERLVHLGDTVKQGQVVARLDPNDAQRNLGGAQADLASATQRLNSANRQLERDTVQMHENLISALQFEQSQDAQAAAQAQFKQARERAGLGANQLDYTTLRAAHDGVITAETADTGQVLNAGQAVFSLAWSGALDATGEVAQSQIGLVHPGAAAEVTLAALPGRTLHARVREVSPAADAQSRTFHVKLTLDANDPAVRLGMSGELRIATQDAAAANAAAGFLIPASALFHQGDQPAVWVVADDRRVALRAVQVLAYGERSVTVSGGLHAGDTLVVQGVHTLNAGDQVKPIAPLHPEDFAL